MLETPHLTLPLIAAAQAQKHITHNEAIYKIDSLMQLTVVSQTNQPPLTSPENGARYLVGDNALDVWLGHDGEIAVFDAENWIFHTPQTGWRCWVKETEKMLIRLDTGWADLYPPINQEQTQDFLGINTVADSQNRLALSSEASLFSHDGGGHQLKINKAAANETASLLYQTGFSGHAEMGLAGDDDFHIKVSDDGATWKEALTIDKNSGHVAMPAGTGDFTPILGSIKTGSYSGASGINVAYARYSRIGDLCFVRIGFDVLGLTSADLSAGSAIKLSGLPFLAKNLSSSPVDQFASGAVYRSIGSALNTLLGGYCTGSALFLFTFALNNNNAKNTDRHFVSFHYEVA